MPLLDTIRRIASRIMLSSIDETRKKPKKIKRQGNEMGDLSVFDHQILTIEEDIINRLLRAHFRHHWFFYSLTFEFEPGNSVYMGIISRLGSVMSANFTIEDLWFDDYTTYFQIKIDVNSVDTGYFILNSIFHLIGKWTMSFLGTFFNPFYLGENGSTMRFEKDGVISFDLSSKNPIRDVIVLPPRSEDDQGPVLIYNPKTSQSVLYLDYYGFKNEVASFERMEMPEKTSWIHSIDLAAVLLLPLGVWISFIILHHYLPTETLEFSWSVYFWISVGILVFSFIVMNIPRYIYMYFDSRKGWQSAFIHNNIKIQMRRLQRRILKQQAKLNQEDSDVTTDYKKRMRDLLMQIRDKRFLIQRLKLADEDRLRKQKVKFVIAYVICTFIEWMLLIR